MHILGMRIEYMHVRLNQAYGKSRLKFLEIKRMKHHFSERFFLEI